MGKQSKVPPSRGESEHLSWSRKRSTVLPKDEYELVMQKEGREVGYSEEILCLKSQGCNHSGLA